jgi:hypothetical protein
MNLRTDEQIFMKYDARSLTLIYQHIPILIEAGLQQQAHCEDLHAFHIISTAKLTNIYCSENCEEQTL